MITVPYLETVPAACTAHIVVSDTLYKSLNLPGSESSWIVSLQSLETTKDMSALDGLLTLKSKVPLTKSTQSLRNLGLLFLRTTSTLIEEHAIFSDEKLALQMLNIVKDFWSLLSSQHVVLTQQAYGRYGALLYEVLPSLASVYIDLFIAVHSTKSTVGKAAKRLYSWLMFELNERSIKTALLEACECTASGARLVLPVLRTVLSSPSANTSNLDYLLHFILLKRWSFICADLCDLIQVSASIQAPGGFLEWLVHHWPEAAKYLPSDRSLKGRRISEFLLELDQQAVEELIDVFSEALSVEQTSEQDTDRVNKKMADEAVTEAPFFIDKTGGDKDEMQLKTRQQYLQNNQRESGSKKNMHFSKIHDRQSQRDADISMLSGQMGDSSCCKAYEEEARGNTDSFLDFSVEESAIEETEFHRTETIQLLKKKRKLSYTEDSTDMLSADNNIRETQVMTVEDTDCKDADLIVGVESRKDGDEPESMDHETDYTWESTSYNDRIAKVPESQAKPDITTVKTRSISVHKSAEVKNSQTDKENECCSNVIASASESKTSLKKYKENPKTHRNDADLSSGVDDTPTVNLDTQPSPHLTSGLHTVLRSNISPHSSFTDQIVKNKRIASPKVNRIRTRSFTETDSSEKWSKEISGASQLFENTKNTVSTTDGSNTEYKVGLMLSTIRKSMSDRKRKPEEITDTFQVKTRLRTKSAQADHLHETRSRNRSVTAAEDGLKNWLRQSANSALKNQPYPEHLNHENKEATKSSIKKAIAKDTTATEIEGLRDIFGPPLKTYSRKDCKKFVTDNTKVNLTPELKMVKNKSPKKKTAIDSTEAKSTPKLTVTTHRPPKRSSEEPEHRRYFLRTNCSHRLLTEDTVCPSCSPTTKV
ncbi:unnamed protein product [Candidula unifasciata]|uniref:Uncharacterized protein n=1 Tax=Candidula unifasciata TaxID=100452 RepID=A0A8S3Z8I2_9EUPU|nr:unnamed protein product [Candidula unifasciata]